MSDPLSLRFIIDEPADGPTNMATDETLLESATAGIVTLRLYRWSRPTISLGYFQSHRLLEAQPPSLRVLPVVRRLTGGGAILHDRELTYSIALPMGHPLTAGGPGTLYRYMHRLFIELLRQLGAAVRMRGCRDGGPKASPRGGPFFCFAAGSSADIVALDGRKLLGSAQRRTHTAVLQHGTMILDAGDWPQPCVGLAELVGTVPDVETVAELLARAWDGRLRRSELTADERNRVGELRRKYNDDKWNLRR